jgi:hypothetical protein
MQMPSQGARMADVFTVLAQDHQDVKGMLTELEKGPPKASGATEDQLALRKKMTEQAAAREGGRPEDGQCLAGLEVGAAPAVMVGLGDHADPPGHGAEGGQFQARAEQS